nr:retrovirus-related Pol polyprotein from transposon TNT 1-94 [Tanacetum cinerariifolium]
MPPTPDLSFTGLDEFVNKHVVENCKAKSSEEEPKAVRKIDDPLIIEEWVLDDEEENAEVVNTAYYVQNRVLVVKLDNTTPYELFHDKTLTLNFIRPFGCPVTILNIIDHLGKFAGKTDKGTKASDNAFLARKETEPIKDYILLSLWTVDLPFSQDPKSSHDDGFKPSTVDGKKVDEDPSKECERNNQEKEDNVNNTNNVNTVSSTVDAAGTNEDNELPFDPNMPALENVSIFNFSNDDEGDVAVANMNNLDTTIQIFRNKNDERGIIIRNKARLAAHGHIQEKGIDYDEVFILVIRIEAIRLFLAYASFKDFVVYQMDVKSAFLYEKFEEKVYVCQPPGFEDPDFPNRVYKVKKTIYRLHQAPRAWYETLSTYLLDNGFQRVKIDKTLFIRRHKGDILPVQVYVDDIIFGLTKKELCNAFERLMHEKFQMSSIGELTFFWGLQEKQKNDGKFNSQYKYVAEILKKFESTKVKNENTPNENSKASAQR